MGDLSKHFSRWEFACHCGCGFDTPNPELVQALELLRAELGDRPIRITSGCRCPVHNDSVESSDYSQHVRGRAADIWVAGMDVVYLARLAEQVQAFNEGGIGVYPDSGFVHVDVRVEKPEYWPKPARW